MSVALFVVSLAFALQSAFGYPVESEGDIIDISDLGGRIYGAPDERSGVSAAKWEENRTGNPEELGNYFEGDILFPESKSRNGIVGQSYRWPNGVVPFEIVGGFDARAMDLIEKAMKAYHEKTCVRFRPRTNADRDYISIQNTATGCWSSVGRIGGKQQVNLQSPSCTTLIGTAIHELMHSVGFFHEQSREERDSFVTILVANVRRGYEGNFEKNAKGTSSGFGVGYDYGSVMHYSDNAFSSNGKPTIQTKVNHLFLIEIVRRSNPGWEPIAIFHRRRRRSGSGAASRRRTSRKSTTCTTARRTKNKARTAFSSSIDNCIYSLNVRIVATPASNVF